MREILGDAKTVRQLLSGAKYSIDYYQREYKWESKHVIELIDDLTSKFFESYEEEHERSMVAEYGHYFLGSIIISDKDGEKFIVDGQQRLTTLTLMLIYLHNLLEYPDQKSQIAEMILSQKYGEKSFNLNIPERKDCIEALYSGRSIEGNDLDESIQNIIDRYSDIEDRFPSDITDKALPYFLDWFIENVHLVEITAYSDDDAYTIFETMNDRGLSLTPSEMLKGYLLSNIIVADQRIHSSIVWKNRIDKLKELGKEEDADAIKSWLRSQYARSIRERKRGAKPKDFDLIGTEFHRWVRAHEKEIGLQGSSDFSSFIGQNFAFYSKWYQRLREASITLTTGLETIYFNAQNNFTLQYPVLLAPLEIGETEEESLRKIRAVATYLDILIHRRIWNWRSIGYSAMQYAMFLVMRDIRGRCSEEVAEHLKQLLETQEAEGTFSSNARFSLHGQNRRNIHLILARIANFMEQGSGLASRFSEYVQRGRKQGYEIEHIWAEHPERHEDEFSHPNDFRDYRNRIGGLVLLPKSFNQSYGDLPYKQKYDHYLGQNILVKSLHEKCYEHNPGFLRFKDEYDLPFRPHPQFKKSDLDARQELYIRLAEKIWDPSRLEHKVSE